MCAQSSVNDREALDDDSDILHIAEQVQQECMCYTCWCHENIPSTGHQLPCLLLSPAYLLTSLSPPPRR
jgi:hypothetical protein